MKLKSNCVTCQKLVHNLKDRGICSLIGFARIDLCAVNEHQGH